MQKPIFGSYPGFTIKTPRELTYYDAFALLYSIFPKQRYAAFLLNKSNSSITLNGLQFVMYQ